MNTSYNNDNKSDNLNNSTENEDFIDGCSDSDKDSILNDDYDINSPDYDADDDYTDKDDIDEDDADAVFDRQEKAKKRSNIVRHIVLVISAAVFIFAAYNLINIFLAYHKADVIYDNINQNSLLKFHLHIIIKHCLISIHRVLVICIYLPLTAGFLWFRVMIMIIILRTRLTRNIVLMDVSLRIIESMAGYQPVM